jgi:transposase-like protein
MNTKQKTEGENLRNTVSAIAARLGVNQEYVLKVRNLMSRQRSGDQAQVQEITGYSQTTVTMVMNLRTVNHRIIEVMELVVSNRESLLDYKQVYHKTA